MTDGSQYKPGSVAPFQRPKAKKSNPRKASKGDKGVNRFPVRSTTPVLPMPVPSPHRQS